MKRKRRSRMKRLQCRWRGWKVGFKDPGGFLVDSTMSCDEEESCEGGGEGRVSGRGKKFGRTWTEH